MLEILRQGAQSWGMKILFGIIIAVFVLAFGAILVAMMIFKPEGLIANVRRIYCYQGRKSNTALKNDE